MVKVSLGMNESTVIAKFMIKLEFDTRSSVAANWVKSKYLSVNLTVYLIGVIAFEMGYNSFAKLNIHYHNFYSNIKSFLALTIDEAAHWFIIAVRMSNIVFQISFWQSHSSMDSHFYL